MRAQPRLLTDSKPGGFDGFAGGLALQMRRVPSLSFLRGQLPFAILELPEVSSVFFDPTFTLNGSSRALRGCHAPGRQLSWSGEGKGRS